MRVRNQLESSSTMLVSALSTQTSSALSLQTFSRAGPVPASGLRMAGAAVMMCALTRPNLRRVTTREWSAIVAFGVVMAAMNLCLYQAIDRLPLGVAVTLDFLGPCGLAFVMAKRWRERCCAPIALLGVVLIAGQGSGINLVGIAFGLGAGLCFAGYALLAERVGRQSQPLSRLALAVTIAAATTAPWSLRAIGHLTLRTTLLLLAAAFLRCGRLIHLRCDRRRPCVRNDDRAVVRARSGDRSRSGGDLPASAPRRGRDRWNGARGRRRCGGELDDGQSTARSGTRRRAPGSGVTGVCGHRRGRG